MRHLGYCLQCNKHCISVCCYLHDYCIVMGIKWVIFCSEQHICDTRVMQELWILSPSLSLTSLFLSKLTCNPGINFFSLGEYAAAAAAKSLQSCPTLWDPIDGSPPGSPVSGILQARTLEWVAISFSNA